MFVSGAKQPWGSHPNYTQHKLINEISENCRVAAKSGRAANWLVRPSLLWGDYVQTTNSDNTLNPHRPQGSCSWGDLWPSRGGGGCGERSRGSKGNWLEHCKSLSLILLLACSLSSLCATVHTSVWGMDLWLLGVLPCGGCEVTYSQLSVNMYSNMRQSEPKGHEQPLWCCDCPSKSVTVWVPVV